VGELFRDLVPPEVISGYERLLDQDGCPQEEADHLLGGSVVRALTDRGMAHVLPPGPADPAWLRPATPELALLGVLAGYQHRLAREHDLLTTGHQRLALAQASGNSGMTGPVTGPLVSLITDRAQIGELSASLANAARQDWMTLENMLVDLPITTDSAQPPPPLFAGRVRCRSIYAAGIMQDSAARQAVRTCTDAGEQARLLPAVPMKMKLADHTSALLPLTATGTAGALLVKAPVIVTALRDYFELLWDRATPLTASRGQASGDRLTPSQQNVLELMAEGLPDAVIARRAAMSTVTVRRHITAIMTRLGVSSRFAAGAAAQRKGWIG
jgi:DNA-binding NarL/FixJ family response regulator